MPEWITRYWVEWVFGLAIGCMGAALRQLSKKLRETKAANDAVRDGLRSLLRRQVIEDCEASIRDGYCPATKKDTISDMYNSYHALGGNGTVTQLVHEMMSLPTIKEGQK